MVLTPVFAHGRAFDETRLAAIAVALLLGAALQGLAYWNFNKRDQSMVVWDPTLRRLTILEHRVTSSFVSLGRIEPTFDLELDEIESARVVRGRGRHLRLKTKRGFVSISNDIQHFDELTAIVLSSVKPESASD
jgi:hypothetical protein